jgi:hypothetical protein
MQKKIFLPICLTFFFVLSASAQIDTVNNPLEVVDTLQQDFGLFSNTDVLNLTLRFDITNYRKKKPKEEYMDALLTYHINDKDSINKKIRLKSRGEMRNGYCDFPPIRLNFSKADFQKADLKKIDKIKLVTHCEYGNEEYLFKEYLIYKLYNVLTDTSFRVRLVKIEYINTYKKSKPINTYAFFIEPIEILAARTNSIEVTSVNLTQKNIYPEMMDRAAIFNYMVGNTDWSVPNQHNVKILSTLSVVNSGFGMIVPYDFDYSGLVNADYAIPFEGLGIESVTQRRYVGICRSEETFIQALQEFKDKKEEFYKVINEFPLLKEKTKREMTGYLDTFFSGFDRRNTVVFDILSKCSNF